MKRLLFLLPFLLLAACENDHPGSASAHGDPVPDTAAAQVQAAFGRVDSALYDSLREIEASSGGRLGFAAIHLESGWCTSYRGRESFPMASVAKLPMAIQFLRMADSGAYRLDSLVTMSAADHRPGGSLLYHRVRRNGGTAPIHDLLEAMIGASDNTASDYILKLSGGPQPADKLMASLGLGGIDISHSEGELILLWAGVDPKGTDSAWTRDRYYAKIAEAGDTAWRTAEARLVDDPSDAASPEEMAGLLAMLHRGDLLSPTSTDTLLALMSRAVTGRARIPALLPPGTPVAHKTGTISSTANDVGIITLPGGRGHLVVAVFVKGSRVGVHARERAIASAARLAFGHVTGGKASLEEAGK